MSPWYALSMMARACSIVIVTILHVVGAFCIRVNVVEQEKQWVNGHPGSFFM
jgi:formate-dependent nitrite reductase membrane component NrfD